MVKKRNRNKGIFIDSVRKLRSLFEFCSISIFVLFFAVHLETGSQV